MNKTEGYVYSLLKSLSIHQSEQLSISSVSELTKTPVLYWEFSSEAVFYENRHKIFLDENLSKQAQWQDFGHEFYHVVGHAGSQSRTMNKYFYQLQEWQADYFSYHFCVPTFMLDQLKEVSVCEIMNLFNVEEEFAYRRLEMYQNKVYGRVNCNAL